MLPIPQTTIRNRLLRALVPADFALLAPHMLMVPGPLKLVLIEPHVPIEHMHFPEMGFTSVTIDGEGGSIEVGMIGCEGLVGASPVLLGADRTPHRHFVQMAGENLRISTTHLLQAVAESETLRALLLRYVQAYLVQTAQTAFANAAFLIEGRLARWILMCDDRSDGESMSITHEFLSMMLGVRRPGVTIAIQTLEGHHLIKATRGLIRIVDRAGLIATAQEGYGAAEAEYARLIEDGP